jgi:hypothetical protein
MFKFLEKERSTAEGRVIDKKTTSATPFIDQCRSMYSPTRYRSDYVVDLGNHGVQRISTWHRFETCYALPGCSGQMLVDVTRIKVVGFPILTVIRYPCDRTFQS